MDLPRRFRLPAALLVVLLATGIVLGAAGGCRPSGVAPGDGAPLPAGGDGPETTGDDLSRMLPRIPGAVWEFAGEGNEFAGFRQELKYVRGDLVQLEVDDSGAVAGVVYRLEPRRLVRLIHRVDGYEGQSLLDEPPDGERVLLRAPLRPGEAWEGGGERREVAAVGVQLELPAGTIAGAVRVRVTREGVSSVVDEFYVSGLGLVARRFNDPPSDTVVTSELASFSLGEALGPDPEGQSPDDGGAPARPADMIMYAYQAERSVRGMLQAAYYAWLSGRVAETGGDETVAAILAQLRRHLAFLATPEVVDGRIPWLEDIYRGGEGETLFPDFERLTAAEVLEEGADHARVRLVLEQHYPASESSGPAYSMEVRAVVGLVPGASCWLIDYLEYDPEYLYGDPLLRE